MRKSYYNYCPKCGRKKWYTSRRCRHCFKENRRGQLSRGGRGKK